MEPDSNFPTTPNQSLVSGYSKSIGLFESVRRRFQSKDIGRQFWMPDSTSINCFHCATKFTTIRRRHHCRICGQIFCNNCCNEMIDSKLILSHEHGNDHGLLRVCRYCSNKLSSTSVSKLNDSPKHGNTPNKGSHHISLLKRRHSASANRKLSTSSIGDSVRYAKSTLDNASASIVIDVKEEDDHVIYNTVGPIGIRPASAASTGGGRFFLEDDTENILSCSFDDVRNMLDDIDETITAREPGWVKEMVEEARIRQSNVARSEDRQNNNSILATSHISDQSNDLSDDIEVCDGENMADLGAAAVAEMDFVEKTSRDLISLDQAKNKTCYDDSLIDMEKFLLKNIFFNELEVNQTEQQVDEKVQLDIDKSELPHRIIDAIYDVHSERILRQILADEKMSLDWLPILNDMAKQIADTIKLPQYSYLYSVENYYHSGNDEPQQLNELGPYPMDIRKRVKIKSILNGCKTDCTIVNGLVFNKNVAHRQMRTDIDRPRILLFACSVGYDERRRSQSSAAFKLTLFDSMRLQETDYIANLVAKIDLLKPDLIFAQGTISQTALELLRNKNITVVLNVKRTILERIAFFTNAELVHSPEMILPTTKVGHCQKFRLQDYILSQDLSVQNKICFRNKKTLMFLEGCLENIGCSVILRGSSRFYDFKKLKNVLRYMIFVHYNNRLEKAFHLSFNCIPIDERIQCTGLAQFYQQIVPHTNDHTAACTAAANTGNGKKPTPETKDLCKLTIIDDCSDPLRSALTTNDEEESRSDETRNDLDLFKMKLNSEKLEQILETMPLSSSPCIKFAMPFLMSKNIHEISSLRFYFPVEILPSARLTRQVLLELGQNIEQDESYHENDAEKDDDYANYSYLFNRKEPCKNETTKLLFLNLLTSRYMIVKPHPFLINNDLDFKRKSQQFIADFRACGPYLRYTPDFFTRTNEKATEPMAKIVEPLSNQEHQNIFVLFSVFSLQTENAFSYCFKPKILDIHYYGKNDMSLGSFLIRHFFFRQTRFNQTTAAAAGVNFSSTIAYPDIYDGNNVGSFLNTAAVNRKIFCPNENCSISMFKHLMRFTHDNGTITVYLNKLNESRHVAMPHKILTWTFCTQCQSISEYNEMSSDSLALSFGKFLELKFYGNRHFNYEMYFGHHHHDQQQQPKKQPGSCRHSLHRDSYQFFSYDQLVVIFKYERIGMFEIVTPAPVIPMTRNHFSKSRLIDDLKQLTEQCHEVFGRVKSEIENLKSFAINNSKANQSLAAANQMQNLNSEAVNVGRLEEFLAMLQQEELEFNKKIKDIHFKLSVPEMDAANRLLDLFNLENNVIAVKKLVAETVLSWNDRVKDFFQDVPTTRKRNPSDNKFISSLMNRFLSNEAGSPEDSSGPPPPADGIVETPATATTAASPSPSSTQAFDDNLSVTSVEKSPNKLNSIIKNKMITKTKTSDSESSSFKIFTTNRNNDEVSLVFEMPFDRSSNNSNPMSEHYQLPTYKEITIIVRDRDPGSIISYSMTTPEYEKKLNALKTNQAKPAATTAITEQQSGAGADHIAADKTTTANDQQTSTTTNKNESIESNKTTAAAIDGDSNQHIDIQFNDVNAKFFCCIYFAERFRKFRSLILVDGADSTRTAVRANVLPTACPFSEDLYIHSLSNCVPWNAVGGKSGSTFLKTRDQRFILKEVSKGEFKHFLTFACDYINYCERALLEKRPSAFVKVVGVYQISFKNLVNNKGSIHYILVMENLFYECVVSFIYDLKGSMRNRKIDVTSTSYPGNRNDDDSNDSSRGMWDGGGGEMAAPVASGSSHHRIAASKAYKNSTSTVLLDENLRQICIAYPLYVHLHSKIFLMEAIHRDSEFLKNHGVMDYSLLVGFDEEHQEFVVGIIDYVRLFNWEKILESRVKKIANAIDPTVVHPSAYQKRFLDAINDYFTMVPDKWYPFLQLTPLAGKFIPGDNEDGGRGGNVPDSGIDSIGGAADGESSSVHQLLIPSQPPPS